MGNKRALSDADPKRHLTGSLPDRRSLAVATGCGGVHRGSPPCWPCSTGHDLLRACASSEPARPSSHRQRKELRTADELTASLRARCKSGENSSTALARIGAAPRSVGFDRPGSEEPGSIHGCIRRRPRPGGSRFPPDATESSGPPRLRFPQAAVQHAVRQSRAPSAPAPVTRVPRDLHSTRSRGSVRLVPAEAGSALRIIPGNRDGRREDLLAVVACPPSSANHPSCRPDVSRIAVRSCIHFQTGAQIRCL